ncbi:hypothetical protein TWF694_004785 [Orbilia ellipsospora]|uniref:RWD domain-containing protein n=1 Tax=Orbilia ellipsospora TaxID=2528407 RepID=A0AAV9WX26_9PEZI
MLHQSINMTASNKSRQLAELTLLETMYPEEFKWKSKRPTSLADGSSDVHNSVDNIPHDESKITEANIEFTLVVHPSYSLEFTLPLRYPSESRPMVYLSCGDSIDTRTRKTAREQLSNLIDRVCNEVGLDVEILDIIIQTVMEEMVATTFTAIDVCDTSNDSS